MNGKSVNFVEASFYPKKCTSNDYLNTLKSLFVRGIEKTVCESFSVLRKKRRGALGMGLLVAIAT